MAFTDIGGSETNAKVAAATVDLFERDPNSINDHLKTSSGQYGTFQSSSDESLDEYVRSDRETILRDPYRLHGLNFHVTFSEIIGEPNDSVFSFDKVWLTSERVFFTVKLWCYRILSLLCAVPAMVMWGCYFAVISFCTIWCCVPCFKAYDLEMFCIKKFWEILLNSYYTPCWEACGKVFYNIRVTTVSG